eukprot:g13333.t1
MNVSYLSLVLVLLRRVVQGLEGLEATEKLLGDFALPGEGGGLDGCCRDVRRSENRGQIGDGGVGDAWVRLNHRCRCSRRWRG